MTNALKIISVLLTYPSADLQAAVPEIEAAIATDTRLVAADLSRQSVASCRHASAVAPS